jgi:hypothetical protein
VSFVRLCGYFSSKNLSFMIFQGLEKINADALGNGGEPLILLDKNGTAYAP